MTGALDEQILAAAATHAGLSITDAQLLRAHSNSVYLLPDERAVARISHNQHHGLRAKASLQITRWAADQGVPVTEPLIDEAVEIGSATVTFWHHYPQPEGPPPAFAELGAILRHLHALPHPPFELPAYTPLTGLSGELTRADHLDPDDREWLTERVGELVADYGRLDSALGVGMVHGDAYLGNTLWGPGGTVLLGDWDETSTAPRELDLVNTFQGVRFGNSTEQLAGFVHGYGWDPRDWDGFEVLRTMRDLHTLSGYIRRARRGDHRAAQELRRRLHSLRECDPAASWRAVS